MKPLSPRAVNFAKAVAAQHPALLNATKAAISVGFSAKCAHVTSSRMMKDVRVVAEIARQREILAGRGQAPVIPPPPPPKADTLWPAPQSLVDILADVEIRERDPREVLIQVMNHPGLEIEIRKDAAKALMPYEHAKKDGAGKKEEKAAAAKKAGAGRFAAGTAPPLKVVGAKNA